MLRSPWVRSRRGRSVCLRPKRLLCDERVTPDLIAEAARLAAEHASPINDIRGSAAYRRQVTEVIVRRLLAQAGCLRLPGGRSAQ